MGLKSLDEQTLEIWSRQFGHLPEPGWRPQDNLTPLEAWEGLLLDDDSPLPTRIMAEVTWCPYLSKQPARCVIGRCVHTLASPAKSTAITVTPCTKSI
jgi:hypothetical protein